MLPRQQYPWPTEAQWTNPIGGIVASSLTMAGSGTLNVTNDTNEGAIDYRRLREIGAIEMETKSQIDAENVPSAGKACGRFGNGLRGESGGALIELALVVGLLGVPMFAGNAEMGMLAYDSIEVTDAANAGALYGMRSSTFAANTSAITTAAQTEAADFGTRLGVTPSTFYVCSTAVTGTQYTGTNAQTKRADGLHRWKHPRPRVRSGTYQRHSDAADPVPGIA